MKCRGFRLPAGAHRTPVESMATSRPLTHRPQTLVATPRKRSWQRSLGAGHQWVPSAVSTHREPLGVTMVPEPSFCMAVPIASTDQLSELSSPNCRSLGWLLCWTPTLQRIWATDRCGSQARRNARSCDAKRKIPGTRSSGSKFSTWRHGPWEAHPHRWIPHRLWMRLS